MEFGKQIDSQPLTQAFNFAREKARAFNGLRGILTGIVSDRRLNEKELLFLDAWLQSQKYLARDADVLRILTRVGDILAGGQVSPPELAAMLADIERFIDIKADDDLEAKGQIDELKGFLSGVASDGVLNDQEITALSTWLNRHQAIRDSWPASIIIERLDYILEDGIITEDEREDLLQTLQRTTGSDPDGNRFAVEGSTEVWEDRIDEVSIKGATFCLTGDFVSGDRGTVETMLRLKGAEISSSVNKAVDYLVIGTLANRDWLYTPHGRKIEKALLARREGADVTIITERTLLKYLRA
ncbi:MAG: BRCT domain-containing protein [Pseudohongiellaceae bacterium]